MRILLTIAMLGSGWAQQPSPEAAKAKPIPEPKNLKVLKVPASEILPLMRAYSVSLGVRCTHCHVQGNFASDENPHKDIARMMIAMTEEINAKFEGDKAHVSCYTCHRGETEPKVIAPAPATPAAPSAPGALPAPSAAPAPPAPPAP